VTLGLYASREQAQRALLAGEVEVDGRRDAKPGMRVTLVRAADATQVWHGRSAVTISVRTKQQYVSRGGQKLAAALDAWQVDVRETVALDIGASTGGFTDCLLQRGARRVYAVDCGTGQLHATLRNDTRVVSMERCNARHLTREEIPTVPEIVVADVSFISLRLIIPVVAKLGGSGTIVIMLVKPQFEAGPAQVQRGGVVRDAAVRRAAVDSVRTAMADAGWQVFGELESPLRGPAGNIEYLLGARM
jgi:23S rRNA (cytidine1920-2'-O)/16S rRNA (cytidine1409-2'-O)-methyltransferase